jgi:hypothetical protein
MPAAQAIPKLRFRAGDPTVVIDHERRVELGLDHWVDGTMGILRREGREIVIAPNGARIARHELSAGGWGAPTATQIAIDHQLDLADHASGGPVYFDETHGQLLLFYHRETFTAGDPGDYYSSIGMAVSDDEGATFDDLGRIVTSDRRDDDPERSRPVELGPGSFVVHDGWFYVYFQDRGNGPVRRRLSVARAAVDDVAAAAHDRRTPTFSKYHDGEWNEVGVGGRSSELLDVPWVVWFDVATIEPLGCHLLVFSTSWLVGTTPNWMYMAALSTDGIHWGPVTPLLDDPVHDEIIYLTIDSAGPDQRTITGDSFHLYRTRATTPYRWDGAWLERLDVSFSAVDR